MPRAKNGTSRRDRRRKIMRAARGYWGGRGRLFKTAKESVLKAMVHSYQHRKDRKHDFRRLWIARISAATRAEGITYSQFMHGLELAGVAINRKALSNMAIEDPAAFKTIVVRAREALPAPGGLMISLEQIRLLEQKVTSAVELIRVLKEENTTLRRGLDSAQRRMKELETLVEGFKTDQKEIESAIVRTLRNLDDLEASVAAAAGTARDRPAHPETPTRATEPAGPKPAATADDGTKQAGGSELDIF